MKKIILSTIVVSSVLMAGGYKIPETSTNAVALSAANIAHNKSADAAYYNPANMVFMEDTNHIEVDLTYIGLDPINYKGSTTTSLGLTTNNVDTDSNGETFFIPSIHYVSGKAGETRIGLSITAPGGLSKRWNEEPAKTTAEEFTLQVVEINPTVAIPVNDKLAVAFGFRIIYSSGIVKSNGTIASGVTASRDMEGNSLDYGYNLALAYKPMPELEFGMTYRSDVSLGQEGSAKLETTHPLADPNTYDGDAYVSVPLPATFAAAVAYTLPTETTIEFVYEKTYWSSYKELAFSYDGTEGSVLGSIFGTVKPKNWKDTNTFRLGLTQELDSMTLMAGMVYDESPVPEETIGFELPDSNSLAVSLGGRYQVTEKIDVALAALYSMRESRTVENDSLDGEFSDGNVLIVSMGVGYKF